MREPPAEFQLTRGVDGPYDSLPRAVTAVARRSVYTRISLLQRLLRGPLIHSRLEFGVTMLKDRDDGAREDYRATIAATRFEDTFCRGERKRERERRMERIGRAASGAAKSVSR